METKDNLSCVLYGAGDMRLVCKERLVFKLSLRFSSFKLSKRWFHGYMTPSWYFIWCIHKDVSDQTGGEARSVTLQRTSNFVLFFIGAKRHSCAQGWRYKIFYTREANVLKTFHANISLNISYLICCLFILLRITNKKVKTTQYGEQCFVLFQNFIR